MAEHYHYGHGLAGYGPQEPVLCRGVTCLAECVTTELGDIGQHWRDQAHGERYHITQLQAERLSSGGDPAGYVGSWESIAAAALRALECIDGAERTEELAFDLRPERQHAPAYRERVELWEAELRRMLIDSGTYPMETDISGGVRFYVWSCDRWECLLSEHEAWYTVPVACQASGGDVPCACRDCMEITIWSPTSGRAPYCADCAQADCPDRTHPECLMDPDA